MTEVVSRLKVPVVRSKPHLHLVSYLGCVVPGCRWYRPPWLVKRRLEVVQLARLRDVEPNPYVTWHHVRRSYNAGTAIKPADHFVIGVCGAHHHAIHNDGEKTCAAEWGIDLMQEAERLAAAGRMLGFLPQ